MDDLRRGLVGTLLFLVSLAGGLGHAVDIEYISPDQHAELERQFEASAQGTVNPQAIAHKKWLCDMFGVRSRLQVKKQVALYNFEASEKATWKNHGSQPVSSYTVTAEQLVGREKSLKDIVRLNREGQLISQLSSNDPQPRVIAYSLCTAL